jgi:hypothetical protein
MRWKYLETVFAQDWTTFTQQLCLNKIIEYASHGFV